MILIISLVSLEKEMANPNAAHTLASMISTLTRENHRHEESIGKSHMCSSKE
jgi:hypothetical protein